MVWFLVDKRWMHVVNNTIKLEERRIMIRHGDRCPNNFNWH